MNPAKEIEGTEMNFETEVLRSKGPVLVAFCSPWSRPCQVIETVLNELASAAVAIKVVHINADNNPDLSLLYDIQSVPTLLYFVDGLLRAKIVGTASKEAILSKLHTVCGDIPSSTENLDSK